MSRVCKGVGLLAVLLCAAGAAGAAEQRYPLGPGDVLEISVWKDEALSREVLVPPDRVISFPLIGDVDVTGLSASALRELVVQKLEPFVPEAPVAVLLKRIQSLNAFVIGKVNKPGQFPIQLDTTVVQLLAMGGGLTPYASPGKILILRQEGGKTVQIPFDYGEVEKGRDLEQNIVLRAGDVVVVP